MRDHVARLLRGAHQPRKTVHVAMDADQVELVEKLSLFVSKETQRPFSGNQVIEEAVRAFLEESAQYITEEFDVDLRETSLTEMRDYLTGTSVDVCVLDTVVTPVHDRAASREKLLHSSGTIPVQMDRQKLEYTKYVAFYIGSPSSAITHFARIRRAESLPDSSKKLLVHFDQPEELHQRLEWGDPTGKGLRRPRYTVLKMLLEAKMIEELF